MAIFAKYDGIDGESQNRLHHKWLDVQSYGWGAERTDALATGSSRTRSAPTLDDFMLVFDYEKAAPKLLEKCLLGEVIPTLEVELVHTSEGHGQAYLRYELAGVSVTSYQVDGGEDAPPTVVIANDFESIEVTYTEYGPDGSKLGTVQTSYSVESAELESAAAPSETTSEKSKKKKKKKK